LSDRAIVGVFAVGGPVMSPLQLRTITSVAHGKSFRIDMIGRRFSRDALRTVKKPHQLKHQTAKPNGQLLPIFIVDS
jgi:hypothetical protein